ncbi:MAG: zinc-dependent alcohol dehydrogenase family protein [Deltaproteobacteria bacterium]|nr:zinc-dependent alcohol dehydrogenase family protein [Deltaproteobacteria bacterium]
MKAWILEKNTSVIETPSPLRMVSIPRPQPNPGEVLLRVTTCGVCHTELDEIEGRTPPPLYPMIPGHQVVGIVETHCGKRTDISKGVRVGVAWIYSACGHCENCLCGLENLCTAFLATGRDKNGGYAEYMVADEQFIYPIPDIFSDAQAAPLLCAGAIGYRSLSLCLPHDGQHIGLTGFGASGHLVLKLLQYQFPKTRVYVFARSEKERQFASELGAHWTGDTPDRPPRLLDAIIDTTPVWKPVFHALFALRPGGRLVINAIRKENVDIGIMTELDYPSQLWMEKEIKSVANVTRKDVVEFIRIAEEMPFIPEIETYPFSQANQALYDLRTRNIKGAKVLTIS